MTTTHVCKCAKRILKQSTIRFFVFHLLGRLLAHFNLVDKEVVYQWQTVVSILILAVLSSVIREIIRMKVDY